MNQSRRLKQSDQSVIQSLTFITQFSLNMLVPIGMLSLAGYYLDRHFETNWIFIVCFFIGAIAGFQNVYRMAMRVVKGQEEAKREQLREDEELRRVQNRIRESLQDDLLQTQASPKEKKQK